MTSWVLVQDNSPCVKEIFHSLYWNSFNQEEEVTHKEILIFLLVTAGVVVLIIIFLLSLYCRKGAKEEDEENKVGAEILDTTEQYKA